MKKFLALMFVCAGLTAMAAAPHVNNTANITKQATHAQVMKASKAIDARAKAKVTSQKNSLTPKSFFKQYGVTPEDNMLLSKRAPKRVDDGMFGEGTHIDFRYVYTFDDEGYLTKQDPFYDGAKGVYFMLDNDTMYCAGLYWNPMGSSYYLPINLDYNNMTVELETGFGLDNKTYSGSWKYYSAQNAPVSGGQGGYYKMDTTLKTYFVNEQYFYSEEGNFDNVTGKLYSDGSIEFNDSIGYAYFGTMAVQTSYRKTQTSTVSVLANDTTDIYDIFRGTQFLVPFAEVASVGNADVEMWVKAQLAANLPTSLKAVPLPIGSLLVIEALVVLLASDVHVQQNARVRDNVNVPSRNHIV